MKENILKLLHKCEEKKLKNANNKTIRKVSIMLEKFFLFILN